MFDSHSTAIRLRYDQLDGLRYDGKPSECGLLSCGPDKQIGQRLAGYVAVTLMMFDKQSNGRRIEVNGSCNHRVRVLLLRFLLNRPIFPGITAD